MRATTNLTLGLTLAFFLSAGLASAQPYWVGPGGLRVRAPGVGVYVSPGGGVSVRAPWTSVYTPGYRYRAWYVRPGLPYPPPYGPRYGLIPPVQVRPASPVPTADELAALSWRDLRYVLRVGAARLDEELDRFNTAESWHRYTQVAAIRDLVAEDLDTPPDPQTYAKFIEVVRAYDAAVGNEEFSMITSLVGFRTVHAAVIEFLTAPDERQRRLLAQSASQLQQSLSLLAIGEQWRGYLQLPPEVMRSESEVPPPPEADSTPVVDELQKILSRFNEISGDPRYRFISGLPAFRVAHNDLSAYVAMVQKPPSDGTAGEAQPLFEELPPPVEQ